MMQKLSVSMVQCCAGDNLEQNLANAERLVAEAPEADLLALPEVFAFRGSDDAYRGIAESIPGDMAERVGQWAKARKSWLLAGSILERTEQDIFNTSLLFDREGKIAATYRKIHLFEAHLENGKVVREHDLYSHGKDRTLFEMDGWTCGFSACYDLRFPELYRHYSSHGAHLLFAPSNFTQRTGKDHWEILLRARAIENQCFVIAPNQCGANPHTGVESYGNSMIVGPWGEILCRAGKEETVLHTELDMTALEDTRRRIPALEHRRM